MNALNAIPVDIPSQIAFRDFLKTSIPHNSDLYKGLMSGTFYCHYGELLRRRNNDPEVSNVGITDEEFEQRLLHLIEDVDPEIKEFLNIQ